MRFNRRSLSFAGLTLSVLALVFAACTDNPAGPGAPPVPPVVKPPVTPNEAMMVECRYTVASNRVECGDPDPTTGGARGVLIGGQNDNVRLTSGPVTVTADTFAFSVTVQNLLDQPDSADGRKQTMGVDSLGATGPIQVFFVEGPIVVGPSGGSMEVENEDGLGLFTSGNLPYFEYNTTLDSGQVSMSKVWKLRFAPELRDFTFRLYVETPVPLHEGWVNVEPDTVRLTPTATAALTGTPVGYAGKPQVGKPVFWNSLNTSVATVDASGTVTGVALGTTTVRATTPTQGQYGDAVVIVSSAPTAQQDTFEALTNVTVPVAAPGLLEKVNDADGDAKVVAGTVATATGGTATLNENGSFTYLARPGFSGQDQIQYQVTDGVTTLNLTAIVNVAASNYWYVRQGGTGAGTDAAPLGTLAAAQDSAGVGDTIFVLHTATPLEGPAVLENGQGLVGQGIAASLTRTLNGAPVTVLAAGMQPQLTRASGATVTLAQNNAISGLAITSGLGAAITGSSFGTLTVEQTSVNPRGPALDLTGGAIAGAGFLLLSSTDSDSAGLVLNNVTGTLAAAGGSISNAAGSGVRITGGTVNFTYAFGITSTGPGASISGRTGGALVFSGNVTAPGGVRVTGNGAGSVSFLGSVSSNAEGIVVSNGTAGTVLFGGPLTLSGKGIRARGNTGGTISFTGAATITTADSAGVDLTDNTGATLSFPNGGLAITVSGGGGAGFRATGGGLLALDSAGTTVTTATGTGLTLTGMNTGTTPVGFRSVSSTGAPNGISLSGLSGTGGVAVYGGTIAGSTSHGVHLTTLAATVPVVLANLSVSNTGASAGISTSTVANLTVTGVAVTANGGPALSLETTTLNGSFSTLSSIGSTTSALILNTVDGAVLASAGTLSGATATTVAVVGGTLGFVYQGTVQQANNAALLSVVNHATGDLNFQGAVQATNGTGLQFTNASGNYFFSGATTLNGGDAGVDVLGGSTGAFIFAAGAQITNPSTGPALNVAASAPDSLVYAGSITHNAGRAVAVDGLSGGIMKITGAVAGSGAAATGIRVANNTGGIVEFTGAKTLSTGANSAVTLTGNAAAANIRFAGGPLAITTAGAVGFDVDGGGTLAVTSTNGDNTVASTGAPAVRILNTAIHASSGVVFRSVTANGGASGIILQNTTTGTFGVTGTGAAGTGGSIQNTTGPAVSLTNTLAATLNRMNLFSGAGALNAAIRGSTFGTLTLTGTALTAGTGPALALSTGTLNGTAVNLGGTATGAVKGATFFDVGGSLEVSAGSSLTAGLDSAVVVRGGTMSATWNGNITQGNAFPLLAVAGGHQTGTITFAGILSATNGTGIQFNNADGNYVFDGTTTLNGGDAGIDVANNSAGVIDFSPVTGLAQTITNPTGEVITVVNSSPTFTYAGSFSKTNGGVGILVQNSGGTVTINGDGTSNDGDGVDVTKTLTTSAGNAVNLVSNTGTVSFQGGGLAITTTTGAGFSATGGGTVQVTGADNTVASTGGVPINVQNTTISASGLNFRSVNATGGANGIVLSNTGTGGIQVSGGGESSAANTTRGRTTVAQGGGSLVLGAGGTISGTTGSGVSASSTGPVILRNMVIQNNSGDGITASTVSALTVDNSRITGHASDHGILGTSLGGLSLTHVEVENNATTDGVVEGPDIWNIRLVNFAGTGVIQNSRLRQAEETVLGVVNDLGTGTLTITNTNITDAGTTAGNGVQITARGSSNLTLTMQNDSVNRTKSRAVTAVADGTATLAVNVSNTRFRDNFAGLEVATTSQGPTTYNLVGNDFQWHESVPINLNRGSLGATPVSGSFRGTVESNTIGTAGQVGSGSSTANAGAPGGRGQGGAGIRLATNGNGGDTRIRIKSNVVREVINLGVNVIGRDGNHALSVIYENNDVELPNHNLVSHATDIQAGATATDQVSMCVDARANRSISPFGNGLRVRTNSGINTTTNNQVAFAQWDGVTAINTFLSNQNPTLGDNVSTATTGGPFTATPACSAP